MTRQTRLRRIALVWCAALAMGCAAAGGGPGRSTQDNCVALDSFYALSGFDDTVTVIGKATVDVDQQRIRGIIRAEFHPGGDVYLDFTSSILFGSQVEDFFLALSGDTLTIVDRERGDIYQGERAGQFLAEALGMDFDVARILRLAAGGHPACGELRDLSVRTGVHGETRFRGLSGDDGFVVVFDGKPPTLREAEWPVPGNAGRSDRLNASYAWDDGAGGGIRRLVMRLEDRGWRCRISVTD
jgi:hypothetical protein